MSPFGNTTRLLAGLATAIAALVASTLASVPVAAGPPAPEATDVRIDSILTPSADLPNTPGTEGLAYVVATMGAQVDVSFLDAAGAHAPLDQNRDLTASLTVFDSQGSAIETVTDEVLAGESSASFSFTLAQAANGLTVVVTAPGQRNTTLTAESLPFDVLKRSLEIAPGTAFSQIGGDTTDDGCVATPEAPVCADLLLPSGSSGHNAYLSIGLCEGIARCSDSYIQALADLSEGYSPTNPATLVMKCDKSLCEVQGGIKNQKLDVQLRPHEDAVTAEPCSSKGVAPPSSSEQPFCVDYVQSTRDNAGDTHLYLLFTEDAKVRFP